MKSTATAVAIAAAGRELRRVAMRVGEAVASGDLPRPELSCPLW